MSQPPRITVVIPSLNQDLYLERAICSVLDQGYENLELMVIDGGSTDTSLDVIRQYEDQIDHWQSCWDSGPAEAVNTALTWATGEYFAVLDADDLYEPHALEEAVRVLSGGADWVTGHATHIDEMDEHLADLAPVSHQNLASFLLSDGEPMPGSATFYRTDLLKAMGGFDSSLRLAYAYEMHARLYAARQRPEVIRVPLAAIRDHESAMSVSGALSCGLEFVEAVERYASHLAPTHRYRLWRACDERRRIYAAADHHADRRTWQQLLKHSWWLSGEDYRRKLLARATAQSTGHTHRRAA